MRSVPIDFHGNSDCEGSCGKVDAPKRSGLHSVHIKPDLSFTMALISGALVMMAASLITNVFSCSNYQMSFR